MPLPLIPIAVGLASLLGAGYGVKKGIDAKDDFNRAEKIGNKSKEKHEKGMRKLDKEKEETNEFIADLGRTKVAIFSNQIRHLVDTVKKVKHTKSRLKDFEERIDNLDLPEMEAMVVSSLEIEKGLASGVASGALMGLGAYGSVGMLATASTGTAIASLSGVAATNATLAWLGGGSLAAGGLGIAGGTAVLGGIVAGPALAITGLVMASKAEQALTDAYEYKAEVDKAVAEMKAMRLVLQGFQANAAEVGLVLTNLATRFDQEKVDDASDPVAFQRMLAFGRALKEVLDISIMEEDGGVVSDIKSRIETKTAGLIEL